ncbi:HAD family hydrolase [Patescibacteria group bacterium]
MKPLSALSLEQLKKIKLVSFDVDGVLVRKGTEIFEIEDVQHDRVLILKTKKISPTLIEKLNVLKKFVRINISSGRSLLYLKEVFDPILWENVTIQGENGLFTLLDGHLLQHGRLTEEELSLLLKIKEGIYALAKELNNIRGFEPKQFLISVHCFNEEPAIEELVNSVNSNNVLGIKWSSEAYNIFPKRYSKGTGLEELSKLLGIGKEEMLVVGNDPNDKEAAEGPGISVTTSPETLTADYYTETELELGGESLVTKLLEVYQ